MIQPGETQNEFEPRRTWRDLTPPPKTPREELHALIELGYAAKDKRLREAAGIVDTWAGKLPFYLQIIEWGCEKQ